MNTPLANLTRLLHHVAATGTIPEPLEMARDWDIGHDDRPTVVQMAHRVDTIRVHSDTATARAYADHLVDDIARIYTDRERIVDEVARHPLGMPSNPNLTGDAHPTVAVLRGVADGRAVPDVQLLAERGFPRDIARATHDAAKIVAAAAKGGIGGLAARTIGWKIAGDMPWPDPTDDWADLDDVVPAATTNRRTAARAAAEEVLRQLR